MTRIFTQCVLLGFSHKKYLRNLDTTGKSSKTKPQMNADERRFLIGSATVPVAPICVYLRPSAVKKPAPGPAARASTRSCCSLSLRSLRFNLEEFCPAPPRGPLSFCFDFATRPRMLAPGFNHFMSRLQFWTLNLASAILV